MPTEDIDPEEEETFNCDGCDDDYPVEREYQLGDNHYCRDCYEVREVCTRCRDVGIRGDMSSNDNGDWFCDCCYDERYTHCTECDCEILSHDCWRNNDGDPFCPEHSGDS